MEICIPVFEHAILKIGDKSENGSEYPTGQLQKGLLLFNGGRNLAEEAVGFGVPVLKQGVKTFFAGNAELSFIKEEGFWKVESIYKINLQEKIGRINRTTKNHQMLMFSKNLLAALHRNVPAFRKILTAISNWQRKSFELETRYEPTSFQKTVRVTYRIKPGNGQISIGVKLNGLSTSGITEIVMMNEQGAHFFNQYLDSEGFFLETGKIGSWNLVRAKQASFLSRDEKLKFTATNLVKAKLFRGMELIEPRLAWAGFGYSFKPNLKEFSYELKMEKMG
jgi:hypothetical protein